MLEGILTVSLCFGLDGGAVLSLVLGTGDLAIKHLFLFASGWSDSSNTGLKSKPRMSVIICENSLMKFG